MDTEQIEELSQVEARTGRQVITSYNSAGELIPIGSVRYRDYEGNRAVRSLALESTLSGREHPLGAASSGFKTVSHATVLDPFLEAGYETRSVLHARGGASMIAFLGHPGLTCPDPITWDHNLLPSNELADAPLELSVRVKSDLRRGHGVSVTAGFFRLVCRNGLVARILDLGNLSSNHRVFSQDQVSRFVGDIPQDPSQLPSAPSELIRDVIAFLGTSDDERESLPRMVRGPVMKIASETSRTTWEALHLNLDTMASSTDRFTKLDLINVYTNLAHSASAWSVYSEADPMVSSLVDLVELAGVKRGVKTFEPN